MLRPNPLTRRMLGLAALLWLGACGEPDLRTPGAPAPPRYAADGRFTGPAPAAGPRPDLLLVVLPGLRHDDLPTGPDPAALPGWLALAHAVTPAPEPTAALASLVTGLHPVRHRAGHRDLVPRLPPEQVTLPEILSAQAGYAVRAFVQEARLARGASLWQGADVEPAPAGLARVPDALAAWASALPGTRPLCAVVVAEEVGAGADADGAPPAGTLDDEPLAALRLFLTDRPAWRRALADLSRRAGPEAAAAARRRLVRALWRPQGPDGEHAAALPALVAEARAAHAADARRLRDLVRVLGERLRAARPGRDTLVLLTSTGGTAFLEHGILGAGRQVHDEQVRVPFVLAPRGPWAAGGPWARRPAAADGAVLASAASLVDVLPTLLDLLALPPADDLDGRSLLPVLRGEARRGAVVIEAVQDGETTGDPSVNATLVAVRTPRWKYSVRFDVRGGTVLEEAYDLAADPGETRNLAGPAGTVEGVVFDAEACAAIEHVRDGLWQSVEGQNRTADTGYAQGQAVLTGRPPPCRAR